MKWLVGLFKKKSLIFIGAELTALYLIGLLIICLLYIDHKKVLTLNEIGDFLAGAFAPLAFFWMVITILMQGKELKLQREELELQRMELAKTSEQMARQGDLMEGQQLIELREKRMSEIEGLLRDFTDMLVSKDYLADDYFKDIFNGRVDTVGFFEHNKFKEILNSITKSYEGLVSLDIQSTRKTGQEGELVSNLKNNWNEILFLGDSIIEKSRKYDLSDFVSKTGFPNFLESVKDQIDLFTNYEVKD